MSLSMKYLFAVALFAGSFETLAAIWLNAPNVAGQVTAGVFAAVFLVCAWAMRARHSFTAASVIALFLLIDVAGVPFYTKTTPVDWVVQLTFGAIGLVGLVAWVNVLRERRRPVAMVQD
jgi:hypothetical protein